MYHETECGWGHHGHGEEFEMGYGRPEWRGHHGHRGGGGGGMHYGGGCCFCGCGCGCGCHHGRGMRHGRGFEPGFGRRFISKGEVIARLEEYLNQLKAEASGVEEHIAELKKEQA